MIDRTKIKSGTCKIVSIVHLGNNVFEVTTTSRDYEKAVNRVVAVPADHFSKLREDPPYPANERLITNIR